LMTARKRWRSSLSATAVTCTGRPVPTAALYYRWISLGSCRPQTALSLGESSAALLGSLCDHHAECRFPLQGFCAPAHSASNPV
jgi:hypothetical protein